MDRWKSLDFGPPAPDDAAPGESVLLEYPAGDAIAVIPLNRPPDNAIDTAMGARLTEVLETIAVEPAVRVAILTGAGRRAFSVGSDLRQRKSMTKQQWLRQRQDFDRTLYTLEPPRGPYQWQEWSYEWEATPGRHSIRARATDAAGNVQPDVPPWNRLGYGDNAIELSYVEVR